MKVVHIATSLDGGAGIGMLRQHLALVAAGVDSRILVGDHFIGDDTRIAPVPYRRLPLWRRVAGRAGIPVDPGGRLCCRVDRLNARSGRPVGYECFSPPFSNRAPEKHPWIRNADVVNLHWVAGTIDWPRFFRRVSAPIVLTLHDQQPYLGGFHYADDARAHPWLHDIDTSVRKIKQAALGDHALAVIGNSDWNTRAAQASGFFAPGAIFRTIYYPLDTRAYAPRPKQAARESLGLPNDRVIVGFACASLRNRRKGLDTLVAALQLLPTDMREHIALLSFGGAYPDLAGKAPPVPWTHLGSLDADAVKSAAYSAMDIFVVPSRAEAFGLTAIEALACETAVIASNVGGLAEAVDGGRCGRLFEAGNASALATALREYVQAPDLQRQIGILGRQHVLSRHEPSLSARHYLSVYEQLLAHGPGSRSLTPALGGAAS